MIGPDQKLPTLLKLRNLKDLITNTIKVDLGISGAERARLLSEISKYIENSIWEVKQNNKLNEEIINLIDNKYTDSLRKELILDIISSHTVLLGMGHRDISNLLFRFLSRDYIGNSFLVKMESNPAGRLHILLNIIYSVESWRTIDFDNNINFDQLGELKKTVIKKVEDYIKANLLEIGDGTEGFYKLYGPEFVYDQYKVVKAFWFAIMKTVNEGKGNFGFDKIMDLYAMSSTPSGYLLKGLNSYSKKFGLSTIKKLVTIINILAETEMLNARAGNIAYDKIFALDNAIETIAEYIGIYHMGKTKAEVQNTVMLDLLNEINDLLAKKAYYERIFPNPNLADDLTAVQAYPDLVDHLQLIDFYNGFPGWVMTYPGSMSISETFNKKLTGFSGYLGRSYKFTISQKLLNTVITQFTKTSSNTRNNALIQELLLAASAVKGMVRSGVITQKEAHKAITGLMKTSSFFVGSEIPVWIEMVNMYTGQIDLLLFDPSTNTIYVVDYKPDLIYNNYASLAFVNSAPQLGAYGLTLEQQANINVQCILFNDAAAWVFDPALVLGLIDDFMLAADSSWVAPWIEFSYLLSFN